MTRLFLIRHGEPEAMWAAGPDDPGLSQRGRMQAAEAAGELYRAGPLAAVTSPLRRCRETASIFARDVRVEPRVGEVIAPVGVRDRRGWLAETFPWQAGVERRSWKTVDGSLRGWRDSVVAAVRSCEQNSAIFTHFVAINAIVGAVLDSEYTIVCAPDFASITELKLEGGKLELVRLGAPMHAGEVR